MRVNVKFFRTHPVSQQLSEDQSLHSNEQLFYRYQDLLLILIFLYILYANSAESDISFFPSQLSFSTIPFSSSLLLSIISGVIRRKDEWEEEWIWQKDGEGKNDEDGGRKKEL